MPGFRGLGVASALRQQQERWAPARGYTQLRVKSRNRFPQMLRLLIAAGYAIVGTEGRGDDLKIHFERSLDPGRTTARWCLP